MTAAVDLAEFSGTALLLCGVCPIRRCSQPAVFRLCLELLCLVNTFNLKSPRRARKRARGIGIAIN